MPLPTLQRTLGLDATNVVWLSADGGLESGVQGADRALPAVRRALGSLPSPVPLEARPVKKIDVHAAEEGTKFILYLLIAMSMLIVAAGSALVVNLVTMLAEERRPRLAVLRALGLTRGGLIRLSALEGAIYSLLAATVGTAIGLLAGRVVAVRFAKAFAQFFGSTVDLHFTYPLHPATLA